MPAAEFNQEAIDDFVLCARYSEIDEIKDYIAKGINVASVNEHGNTALHTAAANGSIEIVKFLLEHCTVENINMGNESKNTPLHWAAINGHIEVVKALVEAGGDPDLKNESGHSSTFEALNNNHEEVIGYLLAREEKLATSGGENSKHNTISAGKVDDDATSSTTEQTE
eukprot:CFRG7166T1